MGKMSWPEAFGVLGIAPTKDEDVIKKAYRDRLTLTNPEDDQEGFKRLRAAYEEANRYAARAETAAVPKAERERDTTPSGLWVERVGKVYANIRTRRDVDAWKELFADEVYWSLEEEDNCRRKMLVFLMGHFRLPTDVWKLLDEKLHILRDVASLKEIYPVEYISFIANRCDRGEDIDFRYFRGEEDADYDLFLQYYDQAWRALEKHELTRAREYLDSADAMGITHPAMEICRTHLLEQEGHIEHATHLMEALSREYPEDIMACFNAAELLWRHEQQETAAEIYAHIKGILPNHYMANVRLTEWYYNRGEYKEAKSCAEKVLPSGADERFIEILEQINHELEKDLEKHFAATHDWETGLELCWCYLQDGKVYKSIQIAKSLKGRVSDERDAEYKGLLAKLSIEATAYEQAIEQAGDWEKALVQKLARDETKEAREKDEDRIRQSHMIRMECYRMLAHDADVADRGEAYQYYQAALQEAEQLESGTAKDISMLMEKASIYKEMQEYDKCLNVTRWLVDRYRIFAAYATAAEACRRKKSAREVIVAARECILHFPDYARAYELLASAYLHQERREDLQSLLQQAEQNGVKSVILDAYQYRITHQVPAREETMEKLRAFRKTYLKRVDEGDQSCYEEGLAIITECIYCYPVAYMLVERGLYHMTAFRLDEAEKDFQKALENDPYYAYALRELGQLYRMRGKYDKALVCIKKAIRFRDKGITPEIYTELAAVYTLMGAHREAKAAYERYMDSRKKSSF